MTLHTPVSDQNKKDLKEQAAIIDKLLTEIIQEDSMLTPAQISELFARTLRFIVRWLKNRSFD